jgi:DNA uptake protein ComE-like DNA-binding protein
MKFHYLIGNRQQRGVVILAIIILIIQLIIVVGDQWFYSKPNKSESHDWLVHQRTLDSLNKIDGQLANLKPFNPNFITDYKGSRLGLTTAEIDRLFAFRKENKYVNSAKEFQQVTKISDSLLAVISPYFKFPDWVNNKKGYNPFKPFDKNYIPKSERTYSPKVIIKQDFNLATGDDLVKIYGIGDATATRILEFKEKLGAFVSMDQLDDIWGLSPEVKEELNKHFDIQTIKGIKKININNLSVKELSKFHYFSHGFAKQIVVHRTMHGNLKNEDLTKINGCPIDKLKIIELYLAF